MTSCVTEERAPLPADVAVNCIEQLFFCRVCSCAAACVLCSAAAAGASVSLLVTGKLGKYEILCVCVWQPLGHWDMEDFMHACFQMQQGSYLLWGELAL